MSRVVLQLLRETATSGAPAAATGDKPAPRGGTGTPRARPLRNQKKDKKKKTWPDRERSILRKSEWICLEWKLKVACIIWWMCALFRSGFCSSDRSKSEARGREGQLLTDGGGSVTFGLYGYSWVSLFDGGSINLYHLEIKGLGWISVILDTHTKTGVNLAVFVSFDYCLSVVIGTSYWLVYYNNTCVTYYITNMVNPPK